MDNPRSEGQLDSLTRGLLDELFASGGRAPGVVPDDGLAALVKKATESDLTAPIVSLFTSLRKVAAETGCTPENLGITRETLIALAQKHERIDEHGVTVGGRVSRALPIVEGANSRVARYLATNEVEAPSGIELWEQICTNIQRIKSRLAISDEEWNSYSGQLRHRIDSAETLSSVIDLPSRMIEEVARVTKTYRMRLTPYYASLIQSGTSNDPILLQCVPTGEMVDNIGVEIPPVAADHSPARLIDQFYPRVVTIKATNMCAMYCTHCLRLAHIGKKDSLYSDGAYREALEYIRRNELVRDVLVTGGDAFVLPNKVIRKILDELDGIDHVTIKRLGTRIPVTAPQRVDRELLDILEASNDRKPLRVVTQINTAQEITPVSREVFRRISKSVSAVLNQAVLLKGINDSIVKMWKLCETTQDSYVRPYYVFNCSYRNPQFAHFRVPVETGREIVESLYGNISGDAIPRYIATAGGKIPLHRSNVIGRTGGDVILRKPWNGEEVRYPDADPAIYARGDVSFSKG